MNKFFYSALVLVLLIVSAEVRSQTAGKVEVGAQFTTLGLQTNDYEHYTQAGFGGRVTFNINDNIAIEGEGNFFPKNIFGFYGQGRAAQAQFGLKAGRRYKNFGVFAKARPGLLTIGDVFSFRPGSSTSSSAPGYRIGRETHFTTDLGGVLEFYPSRRAIVRFDAGDTIVRFGPHYEPDPNNYPQVIKVPSEFKHNLQITAGVGFRLGSHVSSPDSNPAPTSARSSDDIPRFEVGVHFTSMSMNPSSQLCPDLCIVSTDRGPVTERGLGGRFTYNAHRNVAVEAEVNFLPGYHGPAPSNHIYQGQFGVKAGKRFDAFGLFAKFRPGFVGFTRAFKLIGTHSVTIGPSQFDVGDFAFGRREEFSMDAGGVLELYVSRRIMTRMDFGDTIIKYSEYLVPGFFLSRSIIRRPPETRHNFQFTAGVGFRF